MNEKVINIIESVRKADNAQQVFEALCQFPTENLNAMHDMIAYILTERDRENQVH